MTRSDITFASGSGTCAAWLYTPDAAGVREGGLSEPRRPVIVMGHGLGGVKEQRLDAFAERFAEAGYACLVFDYRHFGASSGEPRQLLDIDRQRQDWRSAVAFARTLDGVDPGRVIVWGTSFGGGHVIVTAAQDPRIAAAIAQCPFTDGLASSLAAPPLTAAKVTVRAVRDVVAARRGRSPVMIRIVGAPGSTALMASHDSVPGVRAIQPAGREDDVTEVAARVALDIIRQFPGRHARKVTCPILFVICEADTVTPAKRSMRYAAQAPRGEVILSTAGHFDIYVGDDFERTVTDQLAFLARHVPAR